MSTFTYIQKWAKLIYVLEVEWGYFLKRVETVKGKGQEKNFWRDSGVPFLGLGILLTLRSSLCIFP